MKTLFFKTVFVAIIMSCITTISLKAQEKKSEVPADIQNLMKFIGKWEANVIFTLEGKAYNVMYWVNGKKTSDGNGLYADEGFTHPELGTLKGANLAGFDPYESKIKWFSVDNMGTAHEHVGVWQTPDHLYIEHNGVREGKKYIEKIDFIFKSKDELDFKIIATLDGVEIENGVGIFRKKVTTNKK